MNGSNVYGVFKKWIRELFKHKTAYVNVLELGADGTGVKDCSNLIVNALNSYNGVYFPEGYTFLCDILVSKPKVTICGGGTIKGTIKFLYSTPTDSNSKVYDVRIVNSDNIKNGIEFTNARNITIDNIYVYGCDNSFKFCHNTDGVTLQSTRRIVFNNCVVENCKHIGYFEYNQAIVWETGDTAFNNCYLTCGYSHFCGGRIDGLKLNNNVFFFPTLHANYPNKTRHIDLVQVGHALISGNQFFEAGYESIYIETATNILINGNNISWNGQREPRSAIYINGKTKDNSDYNFIEIVGNNIAYATKHGIEVSGGCGRVNIANNLISFVGSTEYYYGSTDLSTMPHYAIYADSDVYKISCVGNYYPNNIEYIGNNSQLWKNNINQNGKSLENLKFVDNTNTVTALDASTFDIFKNYYSGGMNIITAINNGHEGQEITVIDYAGTMVFYKSASLRLDTLNYDSNADSVNDSYRMNGEKQLLKFKMIGGRWYQI